MVAVVRCQQCPDVPIGLQCSNPYDCPLIDMCWSFLPADNPLSLYRVNKTKAFGLVHSGVLDIRDIPSSFTLTRAQQIQRTALLTGQPQVDTARVEEFLRNVVYPLYFMDFETFATAVPMFDSSKPFTQIPFQYSIHFLESPTAVPENEGYLAEGTTDPRPEFMRRLRASLGDQGSIVVYNQAFERSRLLECAGFFPEYADWVNTILPRIVDLMTPFQSFQYYHPAQHGSASIKAVLPALTGKGYEDMEIAEGGTASREFMRVTYGDVSEDERAGVRKALIEYCGRDTEAMVELVTNLLIN